MTVLKLLLKLSETEDAILERSFYMKHLFSICKDTEQIGFSFSNRYDSLDVAMISSDGRTETSISSCRLTGMIDFYKGAK